MTHINLLPWREQQREQKKRQFIVISVAVALFALLLLSLLWSYLAYQLKQQQQANQLIVNNQQQLELQLKQQQRVTEQAQQTMAHMQMMQGLQGQRPVTARLMDELARLMPADAYITKLSRRMNTLTIEGQAASPHVVANLLAQLEASTWFRQASMQSFVANDETKAVNTVLARFEDRYGSYVVTVDLAEIAMNIPKAMSPIGAKNETTTR